MSERKVHLLTGLSNDFTVVCWKWVDPQLLTTRDESKVTCGHCKNCLRLRKRKARK